MLLYGSKSALQVVEEARNIIVKDTKYETAVVGEDVLLTPRQSEQQTAQPQPEGTSLQEAGDTTPSPFFFTACLTLSLSPLTLLFQPSRLQSFPPPMFALSLPCVRVCWYV